MAVAAIYRIDFGMSFGDPEVATRLRLHGRDDGLRGRDVEAWPMEDCDVPDFTLVPRPGGILAPTLVVRAKDGFAPLAAVRRIVDAVPGARLAVLAGA